METGKQPRTMEAIELKEWQSPATSYPPQIKGDARICTSKYPKGVYECYGVNGHTYYRVTRPIQIRSLKIKGAVWMVDDPPHWWAMQEHAKQYKGHVVCAGLGLGLIVHALAQNPKVTNITVVEINANVIKLIQPLIPECEIVHGDFDEWIGNPDGVFYDLFVGEGRKLYFQAIRTFIELSEKFCNAETIRIHGFNNDNLALLRRLENLPNMAIV